MKIKQLTFYKKNYQRKDTKRMEKKLGRLSILGMSLCLLIMMGTGCKKKVDKYTATDFAMGTTISETIYGTDASHNEEVASGIIDLLTKIENEQISWRKKTSEVYKINHSNQAVTVDQKVSKWLARSLKLAKDSDGALNPGVGYLAKTWNIDGENTVIPSEAKIQAAKGKIDYKDIEVNKQSVKTNPKEVQVDLGALGKGIGADEAYEYLKNDEKITGAVIAVGGSVCVYGNKDDGSSWNVGIQDPRNEDGNMLGVVKTKEDCFVSTSGDYEKYIEKDGKRYHHILDSKTGYPSDSGLISVTIVCKSGIDSDGLSTACFALGIDKSKELLKEYEAEAIFVDKDYKVSVTDGINFELLNTDQYQMSK